MKEILERLEQKMDAGFAKVDERFVKMDGRLDKMDGRLDGVDGQLQKQGVLLESVSGDVKMALEGITGNLDERVQPVEMATRHLAAKTRKPR